jgi:predicted CopG family antitoxin
MSSKNIAITEDLYYELLKRKHHDESFTKIISRLLGENDRPSNYFGKWKDISKDEENRIKKAKSELRKLWTERKLT